MFRQEHIKRNAAPLDDVDRPQEVGAGYEFVRSREARHQLVDKGVKKDSGHGKGELSKEIASSLRGIVPTGVFEIDEPDPPVRRDQGVVKPEVGRRDASLRGLQSLVELQPTSG